MDKRKWRMDRGNKSFTIGERVESLPKKSMISLTRGEGLNYIQLFINQLLTFMIMHQLKNTPGLLYAELNGEFKNHRGSGQTITVWDRTMPKFRNNHQHGLAMKFFTWVVHRKNTKNFYLSYSSTGPIPTADEAKKIMKEYAKFYDGGKLVRRANPKDMMQKGMESQQNL